MYNADGNGKRAKKVILNGDITYYTNEYFEVVNGEETKYIFNGNRRIAKITTGSSHFYHKDHPGNSSVMNDYPDGLTVATTEYLSFGHERYHAGADVTQFF